MTDRKERTTERYLSVKEVAEAFGLSKFTIYNQMCLASKGLPHNPLGNLPWIRLGRTLRIRESDLKQFVDGLREENSTQSE